MLRHCGALPVGASPEDRQCWIGGRETQWQPSAAIQDFHLGGTPASSITGLALGSFEEATILTKGSHNAEVTVRWLGRGSRHL